MAPVSLTERGGSQGPGSPQVATLREPCTDLSPVTGSVLLRVSRSMMESNGTFRKNTLQGKNKHRGRGEGIPGWPGLMAQDQARCPP